MSGDEVSEPSDMERWNAVADLFSGVAHPIRLAIIESVAGQEDRPLTEVADEFEVSRSAVQKHVNTLEEADLVYRPEDEPRPYALTPLGYFFAQFVIREGRLLTSAVQEVAAAEEQAREEFADVPLDEASMEKAVRNRKWDLVGDELADALDLTFPALTDIEDEDQE